VSEDLSALPLLTLPVHQALLQAAAERRPLLECSVDLGKTSTTVTLNSATSWSWNGATYPFLETCKERTIYFWAKERFQPIARFTTSLIKLIPTQWGPPTFEIDGIKMLPTLHVSPYADAQNKVGLIRPRGKTVLDTCAGLGYFAANCLDGGAAKVISFEKSPDVLWLRDINPWSPKDHPRLDLTLGDVAQKIQDLPDESCDSVLHDPPRFGIAGELYSQAFYDQLARVIRRGGLLFHYTGTPNRITSGRDVPNEVAERLRRAGFKTQPQGDGVLATREGRIGSNVRRDRPGS
jgi:predicted methyltransferase